MIPRIATKERFLQFLDIVASSFPMYAPKSVNNDFDYQRVYKSAEIAFDFDRSRLSIKNFFLIPEQPLFTASASKGNPVEVPSEASKQVIFGARPCDITALNLFDMVFAGSEYPDPYYIRERERTILIGFRCLKKCRTCFCGTMNSYNPLHGYDIMVTELPTGDYLFELGSPKGTAIIRENDKLFKTIEKNEEKVISTTFKAIESVFKPAHAISLGLQSIMDLPTKEEMWKKYGQKCLSCGQCVFVCPTCWCFDVKEKIAAVENQGDVDKTLRYRRWTSCLYREFHTVAGGHIFKKTVESRLENYYNHKLRGIPSKFGVWGCVGCGRCFSTCPVGIDVRESLLQILG